MIPFDSLSNFALHPPKMFFFRGNRVRNGFPRKLECIDQFSNYNPEEMANGNWMLLKSEMAGGI